MRVLVQRHADPSPAVRMGRRAIAEVGEQRGEIAGEYIGGKAREMRLWKATLLLKGREYLAVAYYTVIVIFVGKVKPGLGLHLPGVSEEDIKYAQK